MTPNTLLACLIALVAIATHNVLTITGQDNKFGRAVQPKVNENTKNPYSTEKISKDAPKIQIKYKFNDENGKYALGPGRDMWNAQGRPKTTMQQRPINGQIVRASGRKSGNRIYRNKKRAPKHLLATMDDIQRELKKEGRFNPEDTTLDL